MAPKPAATADVLDPADVDVIAGMVLTRPRSLWASDLAIMVAFLGKPEAGFFYSRSLKLLDPRRVRT
jgi:hypothetical protein